MSILVVPVFTPASADDSNPVFSAFLLPPFNLGLDLSLAHRLKI